jgi:fructokinase
MKIISIGEVLWDVISGKEHLGGAPFNFAAHAKSLGHDVYFVSSVGCDKRGDRVLERMALLGLSSRFVSRTGSYGTGTASVKLDSTGQPSFQIHRPAAYDFISLTSADFNDLLSPAPDAIYFGTLLQTSSHALDVTRKLLTSNSAGRRFYDVNLRPSSYTPQLIRNLMSQATVLKLNESEAQVVDRIFAREHNTLEAFCRDYAESFGLEAVCVTRGAKGCALLSKGEFMESPSYAVPVVDSVGAGDAFAAAFLHGLWNKCPVKRVADFANRVGALVTGRRGAIPKWTTGELELFG